jgi:hypothetical protein
MRNYFGDFEVHLTVQAADDAAIGRFRAWCGERGYKCVRIVLARGRHVEQPMATWRRRGVALPAVREEAERSAADIHCAGFPITRVKIEAAPHNDEIPVHDSDAADHDASNYFEHHIKLLRGVAAPRGPLIEVCERHAAHLSRNAFRQPAEGTEERFVTVRFYGVGRATSEAQLQALLGALVELGEMIVEHESEYCVYDSNVELDAGWLAAPEGGATR